MRLLFYEIIPSKSKIYKINKFVCRAVMMREGGLKMRGAFWQKKEGLAG